jgi:rubrerythrin
MNNSTPETQVLDEKKASRRNFLRWSGGSLAAAALLQACSYKEDAAPTGALAVTNPSYPTIHLGSGDIGILNYAYALEQLEAAFYQAIVFSRTFNTAFPDHYENRMFYNIRDHEVNHRNFLKLALGSSAIPDLMVDFSALDFNNRTKVLETARSFEDLGVAAYNGAAELISNPEYLMLAGKIVSVEARHAAFIRDRITVNSFAKTAERTVGLDPAMMPADVLAAVAATGFVHANFDYSGLPTS